MSDITQEAHPVSRKMDSGWFRPTRDQKTVLFATGVLLLIAQVQVGVLGSAFVAVLGAALYAPEYGRKKGYKVSGIDAIFERIEQAGIRKRGGNLYSYNLKDTLLKYDSADYAQPAVRKKSAFPAELISIRPREGRGEQFAFLRNKAGKEDHVIAMLIWDGGPKYVNSGSSQRFIWDHVFTSALKRGLNTTMQDVELSMFVIARSADPTEPHTYAEQRWHPDFQEPVAESVEEKLRANAFEDFNAIYASGSRYVCGLAIRMDFPKEWKRKDLNELTHDQIRTTPLMGVVNTVYSNLAGAVTNLRMPSLFELNEIHYLLLNSEGLEGFYTQQRKDIGSELSGELKSLEDAVTLRQGPFPGSMQIGNDHVIVNRTFHSTVAVMEFESAEYGPGFLDSLFNQPFPFVFSHYLQTTPYKTGMKQARNKRRFSAVRLGFLHSDNRELHPEDAEDEFEAARHHLGLLASKSRSTVSRLQVTVQGSTYDQVQTHVQMITGDLGNHGVLSRQILSEPSQLPPLFAHLCLFDE